ESIILLADPFQIEDAVLNLILNAIEAIESEGKITVSVRRKIEPDSNSTAIIEVEDTGRGIPLEDIKRIFTPFYTTKQNGTGLGLAAVRRVARNHSGRIDVSSTVGSSSVFTISLPQNN